MKGYLLLMFMLPFCGIAQHHGRISFNDGWKFTLDSTRSYSAPSAEDNSWRQLNLPHDWSIEAAFSKDHPAGTGGGALPGGIGWYRKTFSVPELQKGKQFFIEFDGVYRNSEVFINGHSLGVRPNGYISFRYELTPYLKFGNATNVIAVRVDNSKQPNSRWYSGSGIYRNVWLTTVNTSHIQHWGTYITTPVINDKEAVVRIVTKIMGKAAGLVTTLYDEAGNIVGNVSSPVNSNEVIQQLTIRQPDLWSTEKPHLYKAVSVLKSGTNILDTYETTFGLRYFAFDVHKGFSLNGKPLKILGVCNHHDLGALGAAINTRALERQLEILKAMGCNGIRTSHNPPAPELLSLADKMGFIVMDEAFDMWAKPKTKYDYHLDWKAWYRRDLEDFVLRDRNHPSVFIWSIGNEISEQWGDDTSGRNIARELADIVKKLDPTRAVTAGNNEVNNYNNLLRSNAFELIGYNYHHQQWGSFLKDWPGKKLIVTESTSALQTRGHYDRVPVDTIRRWPKRWDLPLEDGNADLTVSAYDHVSAPWGSTHEESVKALLKHDHVSGMYIWTGFDYLGEPTPYPWPARSSYFGIIDLAGFPKDVYYMYRSVFTSKPVLHIYPHWNWTQGDTVDVVCYYNNADAVELFLNGTSLGVRSKKDDDLHVKWRVPYAPGMLKAVSKKNGITVMVNEVRTAGNAHRLVLKADRENIQADGKDLSFVTVEVTDSNGVTVPNANSLIQFSVNGPGFIAGVDNGNPVSLEPFKASRHTAMNGKALCIVQSNGRPGVIQLTAGASGLQRATIFIETGKRPIQLNQSGFYPAAPKIAVVTGVTASEKFYVISAAKHDTVFRGELSGEMRSKNSSLTTRIADFSSFRKNGRYILSIPDLGSSHPFTIAEKVHEPVSRAVLKAFYFQRSDEKLDRSYAGKWQRPARHADTSVLVHPSAATENRATGARISSPRGWYDAGDYNKYIVNSGITMGTLLSAYEDFPAYFGKLRTGIPESSDALPDILNEVVYNLRWMLTMQDPHDGGVYHKLTNAAFDGMVMPGVTKAPRYVVQKGTAATLDFAAVAAQSARILKKHLPALADSCLSAAVKAWQWAEKNPGLTYNQRLINERFDPDISTGEYGDRQFGDEWLWCAAELFVTTGNRKYYDTVVARMKDPIQLPSWASVGMLGYYSLIRNGKALPSYTGGLIQHMKDSVLRMANDYLSRISSNAFATVMGQSRRDFVWGSNAVAANQGILLVNAYLITKDHRYLHAALGNLDYILGRNATGYCFVTGCGSLPPMHPHHRPSEADGITDPVPGLLAGGPNPNRQDRCDYAFTEPETAYVDHVCSYASNEIAINWNAPLVYLAAAIEASV